MAVTTEFATAEPSSASIQPRWSEPDGVLHTLGRHAQALGAASADGIVLAGPVHAGLYSTVYRARVLDTGTTLAVKVVIDPASGERDPVSAARQHAALDRVHRAMVRDGSRARVPTPYVIDADEALLVLEWIGGRSMTDLLLSPRTSGTVALKLVNQAACWLRDFGAARPLSPGPLDIDDKLSALSDLARTEFGQSDSVRAAIAALRSCAATVQTIDLQRTWLHGDFKSDNLLVDADAVIAIDVQARHDNAAAYDAAAFLNHLDLTFCHPFAWRLLPWRRVLADRFLQAFDPDLFSVKRVAFGWVALYLLLWNTREFHRRRQVSAGHAYLRWCFDRLLKRRTSQLCRAQSAYSSAF